MSRIFDSIPFSRRKRLTATTAAGWQMRAQARKPPLMREEEEAEEENRGESQIEYWIGE